MNEITVFNHNGILVTDSRDVAEMVGKRHDNLMRDIQGYVAILRKKAEANESKNGFSGNQPNALKIEVVDFFLNSSYVDSKGESRPCYLLTKKGCEMVANKLTGEKGVLFTAEYVSRFNAMEKHIKGEKLTPYEKTHIQAMRAEAMLRNSKAREASIWMRLGEMLNAPEHKQLCASYTSEVLTGRKVIPLPKIEQSYSAEEVGRMLGISANMVGRIANQNGLKTAENGHLVLDKSRHSNKEVEVWRYSQAGVEAIRRCMEV